MTSTFNSDADLVAPGAEHAAPADRDTAQWRHGTVAWFNAEKGFGFVSPDDGTEAVFVDFSAIDTTGYKTLSAGQPVVFTTTHTRSGPEAVKVRPYTRSPHRPHRSRPKGIRWHHSTRTSTSSLSSPASPSSLPSVPHR
ncbi:cold-shock protein [Nocardia cyriacigeorgica]|jgi:cold shock protein|uniref:cold-shock protein n=1 Tax=Nocardia cyriacigeorgica TaxID=135487 RepID=UPI0002F93430|nr:cold shock domain-containing protein [Nocardia cyriacigeorgica]MBF6323153.1 cold shock domain-containing protein [Nocardia cyriacigeorgica]MBF6496657.1 cold shock domain-containing protein [Nocardia cyriacigeorgica]PPJ15590.1 cold shock domain-containing protein [Nocardia cyriacigeorgica]TLF55774.1 cold shock domain-containing protein [Nocardia cyriacigeorgica]